MLVSLTMRLKRLVLCQTNLYQGNTYVRQSNLFPSLIWDLDIALFANSITRWFNLRQTLYNLYAVISSFFISYNVLRLLKLRWFFSSVSSVMVSSDNDARSNLWSNRSMSPIFFSTVSQEASVIKSIHRRLFEHLLRIYTVLRHAFPNKITWPDKLLLFPDVWRE